MNHLNIISYGPHTVPTKRKMNKSLKNICNKSWGWTASDGDTNPPHTCTRFAPVPRPRLVFSNCLLNKYRSHLSTRGLNCPETPPFLITLPSIFPWLVHFRKHVCELLSPRPQYMSSRISSGHWKQEEKTTHTFPGITVSVPHGQKTVLTWIDTFQQCIEVWEILQFFKVVFTIGFSSPF